MNRYVMCYSQADQANLVCYAESLEDAEAMFENGNYTLEKKD